MSLRHCTSRKALRSRAGFFLSLEAGTLGVGRVGILVVLRLTVCLVLWASAVPEVAKIKQNDTNKVRFIIIPFEDGCVPGIVNDPLCLEDDVF